MASLNRWQGIGRLGKDPEVRNLDNGNTVANFSLACSDSYKDKVTGEKKQVTEWINVVAWKGMADLAGRYLHKGDQVFLEGKLHSRTWDKDGVTRYITEVVVDNMTMLSGGKPNLKNIDSSYENGPQNNANNSTDDLPF